MNGRGGRGGQKKTNKAACIRYCCTTPKNHWFVSLIHVESGRHCVRRWRCRARKLLLARSRNACSMYAFPTERRRHHDRCMRTSRPTHTTPTPTPTAVPSEDLMDSCLLLRRSSSSRRVLSFSSSSSSSRRCRRLRSRSRRSVVLATPMPAESVSTADPLRPHRGLSGSRRLSAGSWEEGDEGDKIFSMYYA